MLKRREEKKMKKNVDHKKKQIHAKNDCKKIFGETSKKKKKEKKKEQFEDSIPKNKEKKFRKYFPFNDETQF